MLPYLSRAVPWRATTALGFLLVGLLAAMSVRVTELWPLEGCALGVLAGSAAWCFDEPAAEVVDVAPRSLLWRTAARGSGVAWLVLWWLFAIWIVRRAFHGHAAAVFWHGVALTAFVSGVVTLWRAGRVARPGTCAAIVVMSTTAFLSLARPYPRQLPLFPYVYGGPWAAAALWWGSTALLGAVLLAFALTGPGALTHPRTG